MKQPGLFVIFVRHTPAQYPRVSAVQTLSQVFFQQGELATQQVRVAEGAGLHDRPFNDGDDVPGQLAGVRPNRPAQRPCRLRKEGPELFRHLVEAPGQTCPKPIMTIAEGRAEVADDAPPLRESRRRAIS